MDKHHDLSPLEQLYEARDKAILERLWLETKLLSIEIRQAEEEERNRRAVTVDKCFRDVYVEAVRNN